MLYFEWYILIVFLPTNILVLVCPTYIPVQSLCRLLLCGDFFQLPPVNLAKCSFAFEAKCWPDVITCSILLKQIFRQNGDQRLMKILNEARVGELSSESAQILRTHSAVGGLGKGGHDDGIRPTLLESRNAQVDRANAAEMSKLPGEVKRFKSKDKAAGTMYEKQLQHCQAPETLELKVGAQVILLKNIDPEAGLVNGSRGVIVEFKTAKNQSDLPREFRKLELPVVKFQAIDGPGSSKSGDGEDEGATKLIEPAEWTNKVGDQTVSSRHQIPLRLAWALSVHKSQGMTIPNLAVSLRGVFEYGQAYVALSRATKLDTLTLRGFDAKAFKAHPKVKQFYRLLESGGKVAGSNAKKSATSKPTAGNKGLTQSRIGNNGTASIGGAGGSNVTNMYQKQAPASAGGRAYNNVPQSVAVASSTGAMSIVPPKSKSPQLTEEQRARMEENRRKALARKQQKQYQHQTAGGPTAASVSAGVSNNTGNEGSRFFSKKPSPPSNPYNPYAR